MGADRRPVCFAYRVEPNNQYDSGWIFQGGAESQCELDDNPPKVCALNAFLGMGPTLRALVEKPVGSGWGRDGGDAPWREVPGFAPEP